MLDEAKTCKTCRHVHSETDKHGETSYYCGRYPPVIISSSSPAMFPKVLSNWKCGEYSDEN